MCWEGVCGWRWGELDEIRHGQASTLAHAIQRVSGQRVDEHPGGELGVEVGAFLRHDFIVTPEIFQGVDGRRFEDQRDLVFGAVGVGDHLIGVADVGFGELFAGGESGLEDFIEQVTLENGDVEASPRVGLLGL